MAGRRCPGAHCPTILTNGERYCPRHAREYETRRGTRQQRGYGAEHDALRAALLVRMTRETIRCIDCGIALTPQTLDLGHTADRTAYRGPQCSKCNRSDGGKRAHA